MEKNSLYVKYEKKNYENSKIPEITIHGRFQPPLHKNHFYTYVKTAFEIADKVKILLVTKEKTKSEIAPHRSSAKNNPLTYEERKSIFEEFFKKRGITEEKYYFIPFSITEESEFTQKLDKNVPNLINTYGEWSYEKLKKFQKLGYRVIHSSNPKITNVSGTQIREILNSNIPDKKAKLTEAGLMPEVVEKVIEIWKNR